MRPEWGQISFNPVKPLLPFFLIAFEFFLHPPSW